MKKILILCLLLSACAGSKLAERTPSSLGSKAFAADKLRNAGVSNSFIKLVEAEYREDERDKVLDLNLLGFLRTRPEADPRIPNHELKKVRKFLGVHRKIFDEVEKAYNVSKEVIASLLWVETKYGRDIGTFHVASVYYSMVQADFPPVLETILEMAKAKTALTADIEDKIRTRAKTKSEWAMTEMLALQEMHNQGLKNAKTLKGSFSGAFGMAQFLPSSYLTWAKGQKSAPNLFRNDDSIKSVANYLSSNGWNSQDRDAQQAALFHYNRDKNYVERILRMSDCLRPAKRTPSSKKTKSSC